MSPTSQKFLDIVLGAEEGILVTASHAIFKEDGSKKAPAAVVGFQFYHSALQTLFNKTTTTVRIFSLTKRRISILIFL